MKHTSDPDQFLLPTFEEVFPATAEGSRKRARHLRQLDTEAFTLRLQSALAKERITLSLYTVMVAVRNKPGITIEGISDATGMGYHAIWNQFRRCAYCETRNDRKGKNTVGVHLTEPGRITLENIDGRLIQS